MTALGSKTYFHDRIAKRHDWAARLEIDLSRAAAAMSRYLFQGWSALERKMSHGKIGHG
jgi:hypothetical protein